MNTLACHALARAILFKRGDYEIAGEKIFIQPWDVFHELCKIFGIRPEYLKETYSGKALFMYIYERQPARLFGGVSNEDYSEVLIGFCHTIKLMEWYFSEREQMQIANLIDRHGHN